MMTLYDRTNRLLFGLTLRILHESSAAEEILLEAYTRIWRQSGTFDPRSGTLLAWMLGVTRTCAIEWMRSMPPDQQKSEPASPDAGADAGQPPREESNVADVRQQLFRSAVDVAPPDYIRDLLAVRIEREPHPALEPERQPRPVEAEQLELKHTPLPRPTPPPVRPRSSIIPWLLAISCAVAAALFFFLWRQSQKQSEQAIQWERDAANEAQAEAGRLRSASEKEKVRKQEIDVIDAALAGPGANAIFLARRRPELTAAAVMFWDAKKSVWILFGHFAPAPAGREYQLWYVTANGRKSAGLIPVDASGHSLETIEMSPDIPKIMAVEITLEPTGGSEQPTSPAVAAGKSP
jgi:DNA-directed RNA polymerase specialized sigma24 family protein